MFTYENAFAFLKRFHNKTFIYLCSAYYLHIKNIRIYVSDKIQNITLHFQSQVYTPGQVYRQVCVRYRISVNYIAINWQFLLSIKIYR